MPVPLQKPLDPHCHHGVGLHEHRKAPGHKVGTYGESLCPEDQAIRRPHRSKTQGEKGKATGLVSEGALASTAARSGVVCAFGKLQRLKRRCHLKVRYRLLRTEAAQRTRYRRDPQDTGPETRVEGRQQAAQAEQRGAGLGAPKRGEVLSERDASLSEVHSHR